MRVITYKSKTDPDKGYVVQECKGEITVWIDEFEGGEAHEMDWTYDDNQPAFKTVEDAQAYVQETYGEVELIEEY